MLKVVFLICENMLSTSVTLPLEQLRSAVSLAQVSQLFGKRGQKLLDVRLVSEDGEAVTCHSGLPLQADCRASAIAEADIIYLPALWRNPAAQIRAHKSIPQWLQRHHAQGAILAGVSTGCYFLAEAGLLDHRPATTHWYYFDDFQKRYPQIELKRKYFITRAGNIFCTGSVNSLADLTIHFIQRHFSKEIATHVERHFFHEIRLAYGGARSFIEMESAHPDEDVMRAQMWMQENFANDFSVATLARKFQMSARNFNRRFRAATGKSPLEFMQTIRIDTARELLQTTNLGVAEVMHHVGYTDAKHFNRMFKKNIGTTPSQYRTTVRAKMFSPT